MKNIRLPTPRSRILLTKLTISQPLKELLIFYGIRKFITVFTVIHKYFIPNLSLGSSVSFKPTKFPTKMLQVCLDSPNTQSVLFPLILTI
jgi:hypothetical protein